MVSELWIECWHQINGGYIRQTDYWSAGYHLGYTTKPGEKTKKAVGQLSKLCFMRILFARNNAINETTRLIKDNK